MKQNCPKCNQVYEFSPAQTGQIFACLECGTDFIITAPQAPAPAPQRPASPKKSKAPLFIILGAFAVLLLLTVSLFSCGKGGKDAETKKIANKIKSEILQHIQNGNLEPISKLLKSQNLKEDGWEFLFAAVQTGNVEIIKGILMCGVQVNSASPQGEKALHIAARNNNFSAFKLLIEKGADINKTQTADGNTIWSIAAENGASEIIAYLITVQQDIDEPSEGDKTIFRAIRKGHLSCVKELIEKYSIEETDLQGNTLLLAAVQVQSIDICRFLITRGADVAAANNDGISVFSAALRKQNNELLQLFDLKKVNWNYTEGDGTSIPMICVNANNNEILRKALTSQNIDLTDNQGKTALYYACRNNNVEAINILLGANANWRSDSFDNSPLHIAVVKSNKAAIRALINKGAELDPSLVDSNGNNLLMLIASTGNIEIFNMLPLRRFDLFDTNKDGKTAYALAKSNAIAITLHNMMDDVLCQNMAAEVRSIISGDNYKEQIRSLDQLREKVTGYPKTTAYINKEKAEVQRRLRNRATENVHEAINSAKRDKYYESAIKTLENAIASNPEASNLEQAREYLERLKNNMANDRKKQAELEKRRAKIRKMSTNELREEVTQFINSWLTDMRFERSTSYYWHISSTEETFFNVQKWEVLGPSDGTWSHFSETVIVSVDSTNKGGIPIRKNWKIRLTRNNDMVWKILYFED